MTKVDVLMPAAMMPHVMDQLEQAFEGGDRMPADRQPAEVGESRFADPHRACAQP